MRSWTAACSRATRTACSRGWRSRPTPSAPARATSTAAPSTRWRSAAFGRRSGPPAGPATSAHPCSTPTFVFELDIRLGAGAFVCGEETALIASLEGGRGTPGAATAVSRRGGPVGPADAHQQRRDVRQRRPDHSQRAAPGSLASGRPRARAPRSSRSPAGWSTPDWSRCRWARRCARSSSTSAAGSSTVAPFKAVQTGGPSGGCIPPSSSTWRSTTSRSSTSGRSWAPAA